MSKHNFNRLSSQDILSAHINGLANAIDNLDTVLEMHTNTIEGHTLYAISDIDEEEYNYRIYEGTVRGWLSSPAPVVKVNGVVASTSEYEIQPAFGVVVFHVKQDKSAVVTVDCTYIGSTSAKLEDISQKASDALLKAQTNEGNINTLTDDVTQAKTDIEALKQSSSGGGTTTTVAIDGYMAGGGTFTTGTDGIPKLVIPKGDVWRSHTHKDMSTVSQASAIAVATNTIDIFPFYVEQRVTIDKMKINTSKGTIVGGKLAMGIYSTVNGLPHKRLAHTPLIDDSVVGLKESTFRDGNITLEAGVYWMARWSNNGTQYDGLNSTDATPMEAPSDMASDIRSPYPAGGLRATYATDAWLPAEFPLANSVVFSRVAYASPQIHVVKSYV